MRRSVENLPDRRAVSDAGGLAVGLNRVDCAGPVRPTGELCEQVGNGGAISRAGDGLPRQSLLRTHRAEARLGEILLEFMKVLLDGVAMGRKASHVSICELITHCQSPF